MFFSYFRRRSIERQLSAICDAVWSIHSRMYTMSDELVLLQTEVAETKAAVATAVAGIADLKVKLDAAIANATDPTALLSMAADLDKLQADIAAAVAPPVEPPVEPPVA
jgi:hypothetical protein